MRVVKILLGASSCILAFEDAQGKSICFPPLQESIRTSTSRSLDLCAVRLGRADASNAVIEELRLRLPFGSIESTIPCHEGVQHAGNQFQRVDRFAVNLGVQFRIAVARSSGWSCM